MIMLSNVKLWIIAFFGALATALGVYVKILHEQKETLEVEAEALEKEIETKEAHIKEKEKASEQTDAQNDILIEGERDKAEASTDAETVLNDSENKDIHGVI